MRMRRKSILVRRTPGKNSIKGNERGTPRGHLNGDNLNDEGA